MGRRKTPTRRTMRLHLACDGPSTERMGRATAGARRVMSMCAHTVWERAPRVPGMATESWRLHARRPYRGHRPTRDNGYDMRFLDRLWLWLWMARAPLAIRVRVEIMGSIIIRTD
jgi:hypothetical protein